MADTKITALTAIGANPIIPSTFPIPMVDLTDTSMAASGTTKKVTVNQILQAGGTATLASATITGDLTVDTSTLKVDSANNRVGIGTASPTEALEVSNGGNIKIGGYDQGILGAGGGGSKMQFSNGANDLDLFGGSTGRVRLYTASTERYRIASDGEATWSNVGGVAGTAMTLNSTGLGVGASPQAKLHVSNGATIDSGLFTGLMIGASVAGSARSASIIKDTSTPYNLIIRTQDFTGGTTGSFIVRNGSTDQFQIDSSGNVGIGVTPSAWGGGIKGLQIGSLGGSSIIGYSNACEIGSNFYFDTGYKYGATAASSQIQFTNGEIRFKNAASGTAGNAITYSQPMTLDGSGNLILQPPSSPPTLGTNGQLTVNATSNTNLRFSYRGSDGVTRVANITLA